jgi:transaldolase
MSLHSLISSGTKVWLDSVDPTLVAENRRLGVSGATSNPLIISDLINTGRFDQHIQRYIAEGKSDQDIAWLLTDELVQEAQAVFLPVWEATRGNDGYVSFELDPLLEDPSCTLSYVQRVQRYVELGKRWSNIALGDGRHKNRMIKVPATPAGIDALESLAAAGVSLNVTLIFTDRQYEAARNAVWRGAQARGTVVPTPSSAPRGIFHDFKSVYSIFISRVDVYTQKHVPTLSPAAQGLVGIVNAKRLWRKNQSFWKDKNLPLAQEIIFASTGAKLPGDAPDKYVEALAGSDIQTNPPATNQAVESSGKTYTRQVDILPSRPILDEIDKKVDQNKMEDALLAEGTEKFAKPFKDLLNLIAGKRSAMK